MRSAPSITLFSLLALAAGAPLARADLDFTGFTNRLGTVQLTDNPQWWYFDVTNRADAQDAYWNVYQAALQVPMGWTGSFNTSNPGASVAGTTSLAFRNAEYATVNLLRYHEWGPDTLFGHEITAAEQAAWVSYYDIYPISEQTPPPTLTNAQAAALLMDLNGQLSHFPPSTWVGYNSAAAAGADQGALALNVSGPAAIVGYVVDPGIENVAAGHRGLVLDSIGTLLAVGDVPSGGPSAAANALAADYPPELAFYSSPAYVAIAAPKGPLANVYLYPLPGYNPCDWIDSSGVVHLSFGVNQLAGYSITNNDSLNIQVSNDDTGQTYPVSANPSNLGNAYEVNLGSMGSPGSFGADRHYTVTYSNITAQYLPPGNDFGLSPVLYAGLSYTYHFTIYDPTTVQGAPVNPSTPIFNLSTRAFVGTGAQQLIGGFVIEGTTPLRVVLRAQGPGLTKYGLSEVVPNPQFTLYDSQGNAIGTNSAWQSGSNSRMIQSFGMAPNSAAEPAAVATLNPGAYTVVVSDKNGASGTGIVEVFNADNISQSRLVNVSTRGLVSTGQNQVIAGIIVHSQETIVFRGRGPGIASYLPGTMVVPNPVLRVYDSNSKLLATSTATWETDLRDAQLLAGGSLQSFAPSQGDAALVMTLPAGSYTAILSDANNVDGVGIVEAFEAN